MDELTITGIRTVGQLLLHHPTTGYYARNRNGEFCSVYSPEASCFCFLGACHLVQSHLHLPISYWVTTCAEVIGWKGVYFQQWDGGSDEQRKQWALKLANFKG